MQTETAVAVTDQHESSPTQTTLSHYLTGLLATALLLYLLPFALLRIPSFESWGGTIYGTALDFGFNAVGRNADVVIFGESSALYGIDPSRMSQELGLKVLNLPNTTTSLKVLDDLTLRRYLKGDRPPRLIVFYFAPWELDYRADSTDQFFEGEEMLFRHGSLSEVLKFARKKPKDTLLFPFQFLLVAPKVSVMAALRHQNRAAMIEATMGHMEAQSFRGRVPELCTLLAKDVAASRFNSVRDLAARYRTPETRTLVFIAPIPACQNAGAIVNRSYAGLGSAPPREMSPHLFLDDEYFIHLVPEAVPEATHTLADAARAALGSAGLVQQVSKVSNDRAGAGQSVRR
jgi:hypothetical protein